MKVWMIWLAAEDGHMWLEAAWDDESTAENHSGWREEVDRVRKIVADNKDYEMRIQAVNVPGVFTLFEHPTVDAQNVST